MTDIQNLVVHLGQLKSGKWIAATGRSPYFCIEANSEDDAKRLAREAIAFYERALRSRDQQPTVSFTSKVTVEELVAA